MNLYNYDLVIINTSGGKDSICAIQSILELSREQKYPKSNIVLSHQDLGKSEWKGTTKIVRDQAAHFDIPELHVIKRVNNKGKEESLLEYVLRRGKWPSNTNRFCTSDFKRGPGAKIVVKVSNERFPKSRPKILYVFGFRKEESPSRAKKETLVLNKRLTNSKREVWDYLPIHELSTAQVWETIILNKIPYHSAYNLGMPRLSCVFCIFSPFDALVVAGRENPELLDEYIEVEKKINHLFRNNFSLQSVKDAIQSGYTPTKIDNWVM